MSLLVRFIFEKLCLRDIKTGGEAYDDQRI
jgi:hypothetical protein